MLNENNLLEFLKEWKTIFELCDKFNVSENELKPTLRTIYLEEKIAFEIQIPQAMNLYMAEKGRAPRNHDEFMRDIIEFNRIPLPKLPEGMLYRYLPDKAELWVIPEKDLGNQNP